MKLFLKTVLYFIALPIALWFGSVAINFLVAYSYTDNFLSWIPYIILGGWVPGKLYGLTLLHSILCIVFSISIVGIFDKILNIRSLPRAILLVLILVLFTYEAVTNFFFFQDELIKVQSRQFALLQLSFMIGIVLKTLDKDATLE